MSDQSNEWRELADRRGQNWETQKALHAAADTCDKQARRIEALSDHYEDRIYKLRALVVSHAGTNTVLNEDDALARRRYEHL